jgi:hypothetical protein
MYHVWFRFYEELNDFLPLLKRKTSFEYSFKGNPSAKDQISVYPVFESMDISGVSPLRDKPLRVTKFVADVHLGRLSKYLRLCGFDTYFDADLSDNQIIGISLKEHRIILTRDRGLLKNKIVTHGYWIRSMKPEMQLKEVLQKFDLRNRLNPFVRCLKSMG